MTVTDVQAGKNFGKILGTAISIGVAAATGQWWAAGLALVSGVVGLLQKEPEKPQEERFDEKQGFEQGGQLAPAGGVLPRIYCNRSINPSGGVRVGGILINSRIEVRRGAQILYQLYLLSAGESPTLGWGAMGRVNGAATLFNRQPRANFSDREITVYNRLGSRQQTEIDQFRYFSQVSVPPDYKVFGVDRRAKVRNFATITNPNPLTINATVAGGVLTKNTNTSAWDAGYFGPNGLAGPGDFTFYAPAPGKQLGVGLSAINQDQNYVSTQYGFFFDGLGACLVSESGAPRTVPMALGGNYKISADLTGVRYYIDNVLVYSSGVAPSYPLYPDVAFYSPGASVSGLTVGGLGATLGSTGTASIIRPTSNQSGDGVDDDILSLFNSAQDYSLSASGDTSLDQRFIVIDKDIPNGNFTTSPSVATGKGQQIYAYWWARYETTKRVDRLDINMAFSLSARYKSKNKDKPDEDEGKLVTHGSLFDLYLRPANAALGSETFIARFLVKNRGTQRIFRALRITNLKLGNYYFELRPLTFMPFDQNRDVWELTDAGYGKDDEVDNEDLPIFGTTVVMVGKEVKIQGEIERVWTAAGESIVAGAYNGNPGIQTRSLDELEVDNPTQSARGYNAIQSEQEITVSIGTDFPSGNFTGYSEYGLCTATNVLWTGIRVWKNLVGVLTVNRVNAGVPSPSYLVTAYPAVFKFKVSGTNTVMTTPAGSGVAAAVTTTPIAPAQPLYNWVSFNRAGIFPRPQGEIIPGQPVPVPNTYSRSQIQEWLSYENKTQVSSESAPTGTIISINEIVHPSSIGKGPLTYAGHTTQGYRFRASERLGGAPGTRALVEEGTQCPNWIAAGNALAGSGGNILNVVDSNFLTAGVAVGHYVRNLEKGITGRITTVTATQIKTDVSMDWVGGGYCGDRYAVYFLGSTCFLPDVYVDMLQNDFGGIPELADPDENIDYPSIVESRKFCKDNRYYFDDLIAEKLPIKEWLAKEARLSYLFPAVIDGRYGLIPDKQRPITEVFNSSNSRNFTLEYPDYGPQRTNTIVTRYVDGRDLFDQSSVRHRQVTITVKTAAAAAGLEPPVVEEMDARSVKSTDQAIDVACLKLKTLQLNTIALSFETSYQAIYTQAGDIVSVQAPALGVGCDYSGAVLETVFDNGAWRIRLDCQPIVKSGMNLADVPLGVGGVNNDANSIAPGFLLKNRDTGAYGVITAANGTSIDAPVNVLLGDEYEVLSAVQPGHELSITYRESGVTETIANPTTEFINGVAWLRCPGFSEPPEYLDYVNVHPKTEEYRVLELNPIGREVFQVRCVSHSADIYKRSGLEISWDDTILKEG